MPNLFPEMLGLFKIQWVKKLMAWIQRNFCYFCSEKWSHTEITKYLNILWLFYLPCCSRVVIPDLNTKYKIFIYETTFLGTL